MVTGCWKKMDDTTSPSRPCSSEPSAASSSAIKPRTYTTAGTIYNPSSAQPLQAPTRRGRVPFRWPIGDHDSGSLGLLPRSALESLPLRAPSYPRPPQPQAQYSPLQQNYDRAISPNAPKLTHDTTGHLFASMRVVEDPWEDSELTLPSIRDLVSSSDEDKPDEGDNVDDEIDEASLAPLKSMTVASLKNLASYPNPQQNLAKKVLSRPINSIAWCGRSAVPKSPPSTRPIGSPQLEENHIAKPHATTALLRAPPGLVYPQPSDVPNFNFKDGAVDTKSAVPTLTNGHGTPQPLTAGPPGQRQYRPSSLKPPFKASYARSDLENLPTVQQGNIEGFAKQGQDTNVRGPLPSLLSRQAEEKTYASMTTEFNEQQRYIASNSAAVTDGWRDEIEAAQIRFLSHAAQPNPRQRMDPLTARWTDKTLEVQHADIERHWYSGAGCMDFSPEQAIHEAKFRRMQHSIGVIGDARSKTECKDKRQYHPVGVKEAASIPTPEHARPLLNTALASISRVQTDAQVQSPWRMEPAVQSWTEQYRDLKRQYEERRKQENKKQSQG